LAFFAALNRDQLLAGVKKIDTICFSISAHSVAAARRSSTASAEETGSVGI